MKTFNDLDFNPLPTGVEGTRAEAYFPNGFGVSVVSGPYFYTSESGPYELAILHKDGSITYDTPITDDVLGHLNRNEVTEIMRQVQELENE